MRGGVLPDLRLHDCPGGVGGCQTRSADTAKADPRELPFVKEALTNINKGGYPEAVARISALVGRFADSIPLLRLEKASEIVHEDKALSKITEDEMRLMRSSGVMALLEPELTLHSLPLLLSSREDRLGRCRSSVGADP